MSEEFIERVIKAIARTQHIPAASVSLASTFEELKIDSLDMINILFALEGEFDIEIPDEKVKSIPEQAKALNRAPTIGDLARGVARLLPVE
jgi:acyl carrier protein